ncbi:hypothetical protein [Haloarchaeobius sp. TZWWS8]|uniref:hypothetical protein n=1 Tax=Haloarchaeobius sp. TZWWS8 TaxID=3446121 RepID=UPI003EC08FF2
MDIQPTLDAGVTLLDPPAPRSTALHRLVLQTMTREPGPTYWVDARNTAVTRVLADLAAGGTDHGRPDRGSRVLDRVQIARAFTAYQHHELVRELVRLVDGRTSVVVCPNLGALYRDDDVPAGEAETMLDAAVALLSDLARAREVPVLVTAQGDAADRVAAVADRELECTRTRAGFRFEGEDFRTDVYPVDGGWQTTIPYWVELFGSVEERSVALDPTAAAELLGVA